MKFIASFTRDEEILTPTQFRQKYGVNTRENNSNYQLANMQRNTTSTSTSRSEQWLQSWPAAELYK